MKLLSALVIASLVSVASFAAEETKWEITGNFAGSANAGQDGGLTITNTTVGAATTGTNTMAWGFQGGVFYNVMPWIQVGLLPSLQSTSTTIAPATTGTSTFGWAAALGVNFNFPMDAKISDAFFLGLRIGYGSTTDSTAGVASTTTKGSGLIWGAEVGKRFAIFNNISWRPSFGLISSSQTPSATGSVATSNMSWVLNLLAVGMTW